MRKHHRKSPINLVKMVEELYSLAAKDLGDDLHGYSVLDLAADNITEFTLVALRHALVASNIAQVTTSQRIKDQIAGYAANLR